MPIPNGLLLLDRIPIFYFLVLWPISAAIYLLFFYLYAVASGWRYITRHFRALGQPDYRRFRPLHTVIGRGLYQNNVVFSPLSEGLWMEVPLPVRLSHPTLLVPWHQVSSVVRKRTLFGRFSYTLQLNATHKSISITIYHAELADLIEVKRRSAFQTAAPIL